MKRFIIVLALISCTFSTVVFLNDATNDGKKCAKFECNSAANSATDGGCQEFSGTIASGDRLVKEFTCADKENVKQVCLYNLVTVDTATEKVSCTPVGTPTPPIVATRTQYAGEACKYVKADTKETDCTPYGFYKKNGEEWELVADSTTQECSTDKCVGNAVGEPCTLDSGCNVGHFCDKTNAHPKVPNSGMCAKNRQPTESCTTTSQCALKHFCNGTAEAKTCVPFFSVALGKSHSFSSDAAVACQEGYSVNDKCVTIHNKLTTEQKLNDFGVRECNIDDACAYEYHDGTEAKVDVTTDARVSLTCVCGYNSKAQGYCSFTHDSKGYVAATDVKGVYGNADGHNSRRFQLVDIKKGVCQASYTSPTWSRHHQEDCSLNKSTVCQELSTKFLTLAFGLLSMFFLF
jgi:hypothetical protein